MSMSTVISVTCDKCPEYVAGDNGMKTRDIRATAKSVGWKLGKKRDLCPSCAKEIATQIKQLQSGES